MDLTEYFREFFDELWVKRSPHAFTRRSPQLGSTGIASSSLADASYRQFVGLVHEVFETTRLDIVHSVQNGDEIALSLRFHGTTKGGVSVQMRGAAFARVENEKIVRADNLFDAAGLLAAYSDRRKGVQLGSAATLADAVRAIHEAESR